MPDGLLAVGPPGAVVLALCALPVETAGVLPAVPVLPLVPVVIVLVRAGDPATSRTGGAPGPAHPPPELAPPRWIA